MIGSCRGMLDNDSSILGDFLTKRLCFLWIASRVCERKWLLRWPDVRNILSQWVHLKGFKPEWQRNSTTQSGKNVAKLTYFLPTDHIPAFFKTLHAIIIDISILRSYTAEQLFNKHIASNYYINTVIKCLWFGLINSSRETFVSRRWVPWLQWPMLISIPTWAANCLLKPQWLRRNKAYNQLEEFENSKVTFLETHCTVHQINNYKEQNSASF